MPAKKKLQELRTKYLRERRKCEFRLRRERRQQQSLTPSLVSPHTCAMRRGPLRSSLLCIFHPVKSPPLSRFFRDRPTRWPFRGEIAISTARCTSAIAVTPISLRHTRPGKGKKRKKKGNTFFCIWSYHFLRDRTSSGRRQVIPSNAMI